MEAETKVFGIATRRHNKFWDQVFLLEETGPNPGQADKVPQPFRLDGFDAASAQSSVLHHSCLVFFLACNQ